MTGDAAAIARACADAMWADDEASRALGMKLLRVGPGEAEISMPVTSDKVNGQKICHGGFIFLLADSTFAFACNTYNQKVVAQHCAVSFLRPAQLDDVLTAHAREVHRGGRSGIYDVSVTRADGIVIAAFRGHSRVIEGTWLNEANA
ncbi:MAG: acyl-CoA thioesterase [Methylobacteriaceae bacterium]|nr:acyl-CoA thioesterase [Methylobacteriaceae bacterium]